MPAFSEDLKLSIVSGDECVPVYTTEWTVVYDANFSHTAANVTHWCTAANCSCSEDGTVSTLSPWENVSCGCSCNATVSADYSNCDEIYSFTQAIAAVQPVPGFQEAHLSYSAGNTVDLMLRCRFTTALQTGTSLALFLPGFTYGVPTSDPVKSIPVTSEVFNVKAQWHQSGDSAGNLFLTLRKEMNAMALVQARIGNLVLENVTLFREGSPTLHAPEAGGEPKLVSASGIPLHRLRHLLSSEWEHQLSQHKSFRDRSHILKLSQFADLSPGSDMEGISGFNSQAQAMEDEQSDSDEPYLLSAQRSAASARSSLLRSQLSQLSVSTQHHQGKSTGNLKDLIWVRQNGQEGMCQVMVNSTIRYTPSDVLVPITITISFDFSSPVYEDTPILRILLPQLTRPGSPLCGVDDTVDCRVQLLLSEIDYWSVALWDEHSKILEVFSAGDFAWDSQAIEIPKSAGFQIIREGVAAQNPDVAFLWEVGADDPDCKQPIEDSPAVGSFLESTLQFVPGTPGIINNMHFHWIAAMAIQAGEAVDILMPSISGPDFENEPPLRFSCDSSALTNSSVSPPDVYVSWEEGLKKLTLHFAREIEAYIGCSLLVGSDIDDPSAPGAIQLMVPVQGFPSGTLAGFFVSSNALLGPVGDTPLAGLIGIGAIYDTSLRYVSSLGRETNADLKFTTSMSLAAGDVVTLNLPSFGGDSSECVRILQSKSTPLGTVVSVGWSSETEQLSLTIARSIVRDTPITVMIPSDAGLILPAEGLALNQETLTIRADATAATASDVSIEESDPIGSFLDSPRLEYDPPTAGEASKIIFTFRPQMELVFGETVTLLLGGFVKADGLVNPFTITSTPNCFRLANWYSESSEVELVVSSVVELGQEVTVEIPKGNIVLPVKGLDANQLALKLRTNAAAGPNPGVSVTTSQAVGSLWSESKLPYLGFDYLYLDFPATITLKLTTTMPVAVGEHFNLSLPGFTNVRGESVDDVELDSYWGSRMSGKWLQEHSTFYFTMKVSVDIGVLYEVVISSNNGVR